MFFSMQADMSCQWINSYVENIGKPNQPSSGNTNSMIDFRLLEASPQSLLTCSHFHVCMPDVQVLEAGAYAPTGPCSWAKPVNNS